MLKTLTLEEVYLLDKLEYNILNGVVIKEGYIRVTMHI
jgi:hypothetical protein